MGVLDAAALGCRDSDTVGASVAKVGDELGLGVGVIVGLLLELKEGPTVGRVDGVLVGALDGVAVGLDEGSRLGASLGQGPHTPTLDIQS